MTAQHPPPLFDVPDLLVGYAVAASEASQAVQFERVENLSFAISAYVYQSVANT